MKLTTRWALYILSDRRQLDVYQRLGSGEIQPRGFDEALLNVIASGRVDDFGYWPQHQERGARTLLTRASRLSPPLVLRALMHLARRYLVWHAGALHFEPTRLLEWREKASHHVDPDALVLTAAAIDVWGCDDSVSAAPRIRPLDPRVTQVVTSAPLIPPITLPAVEQLRQAGLVEVHRHRSLSRLPALLWGEVLKKDILDVRGGPPLPYPSWSVLVRHARRLRAALLKFVLAGEEYHDPTLTQLNVLLMPQPFVRSPDEDPLTDRTDGAARLPGARQGHTSRERALVLQIVRSLALPDAPAWVGWAFHSYLLLYHQALQAILQPASGRKGLDRFKTDYVDSQWHDLESAGHVRNSLQQAWRTGGVHWFEAKVSPSKPPRQQIEMLLEQTAPVQPSLLERLFPGRSAGSVGTPSRPSTLGPDPYRLLQPDYAQQIPAVRLVFHFIRQLDSPRCDAGLRRVAFSALRDQAHHQALSLLRDASDPRYGGYIVGLDVASLETDCPVEVFAPLLRAIRSPWPIPSLALAGIDRSRTGDFGLSVHAGEEFYHLAEGIRRVVETLDFCGYRAGDRLGHALALGIEPEAWAGRWGSISVMPARVRLDDLVWMIDALQRLPAHTPTLSRLERERQRLCRTIYGTVHDLGTMLDAWRLRGEDPLVYRWDATLPLLSPIRRFTQDSLHARLRGVSDNARDLWWQTLVDPAVHQRGEELVELELELTELNALRDLQDVVLRRLVAQRIAIEINPSSNLAIGPFECIREHPVFRWDPPDDDPNAIRPSIVVGSDDPAIFGSELLHEYGLLALAAEERGTHPRDISRWLRELHHNAQSFGFGLSPTQTPERLNRMEGTNRLGGRLAVLPSH